MKKVSGILLALVMVFALSACGPENKEYKDSLFIVGMNESGYGLVNHKNKVVVPLEYNYVFRCGDSYIAKDSSDMYFFNSEGEEVFMLENAEAYRPLTSEPGVLGCPHIAGYERTHTLLPFVSTVTDLFGFVDFKGNEVLADEFLNVIPAVNQDVYFVRTSSGWNAIDEDGDYIFSSNFNNILQFSNKLIAASTSSDYAIFNFDGDMLLDYEYDLPLEYFNGEYSVLKKGYKEGVIDNQGNIVLDFEYKDIKVLKHDLFMAKELAEYEIVNIHGTKTIELDFLAIKENLVYDVMSVATANGYAVYDYSGNVILNDFYQSITFVEDKIFATKQVDGKEMTKVFDIEGNELFEVEGDINYTASTSYIAYKDSYYALLDEDGEIILDYEFLMIQRANLQDPTLDLVIVELAKENKNVLYNLKGKAISDEYDYIGSFSLLGLAPVELEGKCGYINQDGDVVIDVEYDNCLPQ